MVVHKPAGVPSQAAEADRPDDLALRLKLFLAERQGLASEPYLGTHQRLDRDTSGVILFTKRKEANASIAAQFEQRKVKKSYVAAVRGLPSHVRTATLVHDLRRVEGHVEVVSPSGNGQRAVTHLSVRARNADRALVDLTLETGRMHQARVQLAHEGAPIAGDPIYGGALAPRLMLHAISIGFSHPRTGKRMVIADHDISALERWLAKGDLGAGVYDDDAALDAAIALAVERRWGLGQSADRDSADRKVTAFRLINEEGDALPGLAVDTYGDYLVAQIHESAIWQDPLRQERVLDKLGALGFRGIYLKIRPKQANLLADTRRESMAPASPVRGEAAPDSMTIHEEGIAFPVRLFDGLSTGIFLDQRHNRRLLRTMAKGAKVANLFSYTCAFSVVSALGGAARTISVDAAAVALERGREAFVVAGVDLEGVGALKHSFVVQDAFAWLGRTSAKGDKFDVLVIDPPSYSSTKKRRFVAESDYGELIALAVRVLAPGGKIIACCNHRGISRARFRRMVRDGVRAAGRELVQEKDLPCGHDFPQPLGKEAFMKSVLVTVS